MNGAANRTPAGCLVACGTLDGCPFLTHACTYQGSQVLSSYLYCVVLLSALAVKWLSYSLTSYGMASKSPQGTWVKYPARITTYKQACVFRNKRIVTDEVKVRTGLPRIFNRESPHSLGIQKRLSWEALSCPRCIYKYLGDLAIHQTLSNP